MKFSTTLLFIEKANSKVNMIKHANISGLHRQGQETDSNFRDAYLEFYPSNKYDL
jgi:hypothetical protein